MPVAHMGKVRMKMKLYFYILDRNANLNPETRTFGKDTFAIRVEECEVIEKPRTYSALTKFPKGIYCAYVKKGDIGKIPDSSTEYIVLEEPNYQFAKDKFLEKYNAEISRLKNAIAMYEDKIAAVEDYKEDTKC